LLSVTTDIVPKYFNLIWVKYELPVCRGEGWQNFFWAKTRQLTAEKYDYPLLNAENLNWSSECVALKCTKKLLWLLNSYRRYSKTFI
jgi:hypothetical protein